MVQQPHRRFTVSRATDLTQALSEVELKPDLRKKLIALIWKKLNQDDKMKPAKLKKTWAYRPDIAKAVGVSDLEKFSLLDLDDDKLIALGKIFGVAK